MTDGNAVPTSLTVNPSLTIAALAERASVAIAACRRGRDRAPLRRPGAGERLTGTARKRDAGTIPLG